MRRAKHFVRLSPARPRAGRVRRHADGDAVEAFVDRYYAQVAARRPRSSPTPIICRAPRSRTGDLGAQRPADTPIVSVRNPTAASDGWDAPHTVVDVVNDDMPFLVDSVTMALDRHGLGVHLVVHPVLDDRAAACRSGVRTDGRQDRPRVVACTSRSTARRRRSPRRGARRRRARARTTCARPRATGSRCSPRSSRSATSSTSARRRAIPTS